MSSFGIRSKRTITPAEVREAVTIICDGLITEISENAPADLEIIDVGNKILMSGIIDPHVHINEPGRTEWEGFFTATQAAISGGVTTVVDMPLNSSPVTTSVNALEQKISASLGQRHTNIGFWAGIIPGNQDQILPLAEKGVLGYKAFLTHSGIDEFPNVTEADLRLAMPLIAKTGLPLLVHCELISSNGPVIRNAGEPQVKYHDYLHSRPRQWENEAISLIIRLCEETGCRVHIVHLSSSDSIQQIREAKARHLPITVETGQHYLYFNSEDIGNGRTQFKCAPPIREKENNDKLWSALKEGIIDFVATDHSPCTPRLKELESGDFSKAWGGIASLQFALPVLWTAARKRGCSINDIALWLSEKPSLLAGLEESKGKIAIGYDADLVVWDDEISFSVEPGEILHRHKITPYFHEMLWGKVSHTFISGQLVFDKGKIVHNKGRLIGS